MKIELSKEYQFGSDKVKELELDFDNITAMDFLDYEREYKTRNKASIVKELEDGWALTVAARTSGYKYGDLLKLTGLDYLKVVNKTKNFLNQAWDLEEKNTVTEETVEE